MWAPVGPYPAAAAADWLISIYKFVGGGPGRIPLRGSESTEIRNETSGRHLSSRDAAALAWRGALSSSPSLIPINQESITIVSTSTDCLTTIPAYSNRPES